MKTIKKILTIAFIGLGLSLVAQDNSRMDKIKVILDKALKASETSPKSIPELSDKMTENASLYEEYYAQKDYKSAIAFWRPLFFNAPKYSENLHLRGIKMYKTFAKKAEGETKQAYLDTMYAIHDARIMIFEPKLKFLTRKAFDWYSYRSRGNEGFVFDMFTAAKDNYVEEGKENSMSSTFLLYYGKSAVKANKKSAIGNDKVLEVYETITNVVDYNLAEGKDAGKYKGTQDEITELLKKEGYLDCTKLQELAEKRFRANPNDETSIIKAYKSLKAGGCTNSALFTEIVTKLVEVRPTTGLYKFLASKAQKDGNGKLAVSYLEKAIDLETSSDEKAKLYYQIARKHVSNGSLSSAREYARKMLDINPNSGPAYMIIGSTYAASGKICGSGNDFKSHTVAWAAIDTWQKAKSIDPSVAADAQKLINKYSQYMPSKEEIFYEGLTMGGSYTISCLGVTTKVRASK